MKLPRFDVPNHEQTLPVSGKVFKFRPYTVKEEKILMMGVQSEDVADKVNAVNQIVSICSDVDVVNNHPVDVEFAFLQIRSCSVSSAVEVNFEASKQACGLPPEDTRQCLGSWKAGFDIRDVTVENLKEAEKYAIRRGDNWIVMLDEKIGIELQIKSVNNAASALFDMVVSIIDDESVYTKEDFNLVDFEEFIGSVPPYKLAPLNKFIDAVPYTKAVINTICPTCKKQFTYETSGVVNFLV
jgi:hypothetical protein